MVDYKSFEEVTAKRKPLFANKDLNIEKGNLSVVEVRPFNWNTYTPKTPAAVKWAEGMQKTDEFVLMNITNAKGTFPFMLWKSELKAILEDNENCFTKAKSQEDAIIPLQGAEFEMKKGILFCYSPIGSNIPYEIDIEVDIESMDKKILFIDNTHTTLIDELTLAGFQCDYFPTYTTEDYERIIPDYFGIIIRSKILMDKQMIDKAKNLKFIGRVGSGMESIDIKYAENKGIACLNSPEGNRDAVGEHALSMLLCLFNKLKFADLQMREGIRDREGNRGVEIKGKTIGIIGYGNMGSAFAQRLKGFEANVIAYDKYKKGFGNKHVTEVSLEDIFANTDILSFHIPLTDETNYMFDEAFIHKFKKDFYLINTARGAVVKTDALVDALKIGKVKGACLDVIEYEKFSFEEMKTNQAAYQYLLNAENVLLSPHVAGWTVESKYKLAKVLADKIKDRFCK